ncbi:MAG: SRPBCC domain-containing protein [Anaerolineae bacterium]|nr:SRPBCC domain-containing protein [Anaerolineae bacterium]
MPVGKTKGQGWEIGVRKTFPVGTGHLWEALMTQPGLGYWLGSGVEANFQKGDMYKTSEGTAGEIRSFKAGSLIRLTWQPKGANSPSTLQIRVIAAQRGSTLSIHHEKLMDAQQREAMHQHWSVVIKQFEILLGRK